MVAIPDEVKKMIRTQEIIVVASVDDTGICNISPRTTFALLKDEVFWLELFKHKSYVNIKKNNWVSVAVFDKKKLSGFQLKGNVSLVRDKEKKQSIISQIADRLTRLHKERILKQITTQTVNVAKFKPKIIYSLNPNEFSDVPIVLDASVDLGRLAVGENSQQIFGFTKKNLESR